MSFSSHKQSPARLSECQTYVTPPSLFVTDWAAAVELSEEEVQVELSDEEVQVVVRALTAAREVRAAGIPVGVALNERDVVDTLLPPLPGVAHTIRVVPR